MGQIQVQDLRCMTDRLQYLEGQASRTAHLSQAPDPGLARKNNFQLSVREGKKIITERLSNPAH